MPESCVLHRAPSLSNLLVLSLVLVPIYDGYFKILNLRQLSIRVGAYNEEKQSFKGVLKICSKFTGEPPCQSAISIKLLCKFIDIALRHRYSPVNSLYMFRTHFCKNTYGGLLLNEVADTDFSSRNNRRFLLLICI